VPIVRLARDSPKATSVNAARQGRTDFNQRVFRVNFRVPDDPDTIIRCVVVAGVVSHGYRLLRRASQLPLAITVLVFPSSA